MTKHIMASELTPDLQRRHARDYCRSMTPEIRRATMVRLRRGDPYTVPTTDPQLGDGSIEYTAVEMLHAAQDILESDVLARADGGEHVQDLFPETLPVRVPIERPHDIMAMGQLIALADLVDKLKAMKATAPGFTLALAVVEREAAAARADSSQRNLHAVARAGVDITKMRAIKAEQSKAGYALVCEPYTDDEED